MTTISEMKHAKRLARTPHGTARAKRRQSMALFHKEREERKQREPRITFSFTLSPETTKKLKLKGAS